MGLLDLFRNKAEHKTWRRLDDANVPGEPGVEIGRDDAYFVIRMTEMYLKSTRKLWRKFYPLLHGFTDHMGREQHAVAGPGQLRELGEANLDRVMNFNYRLAGPTPYMGGDVVILAGLYSVPGGDAAKALIDTVGMVAALAGGGGGAAIDVTKAVKGGIESLLGLSEAALSLGVRDSFFPGAQNPLRSGYHVAIDARSDEVSFDRLYLREGRLVSGQSPETAVPYDAHDYMVLQIERREERDDWPGLPAIIGFEKKFSEVITSTVLDAAQKKQKLNELWPSFTESLHGSPDLITRDRKRIAASVAADLKLRVGALGGLGLERVRGGAAKPSPFDFLEIPLTVDLTTLKPLGADVPEALEHNPFGGS